MDSGDVTIAVPEVGVDAGQPRKVSSNAGTLRTNGLTAWFGKACIITDISVDLPAGSVTSIIGPSGCGKSTFLRVLNRMHELVPSAALAGEVLLDGEDIYAPGVPVALTRLRIGMVFQKPNPFPTMSIGENVLSGLKLAGLPCRDKPALIERCLVRAGLWNEVKDRLDDAAGALSGGQQQRLCIARALAVNPRVLLMDEPCSALDPTSTRRIEDTIREISEDVTVVIVTHNMQQAARASDYCAFFLGEGGPPGHIIEFGKTQEVFTAPNDPRTEDYIHGRFG